MLVIKLASPLIWHLPEAQRMQDTVRVRVPWGASEHMLDPAARSFGALDSWTGRQHCTELQVVRTRPAAVEPMSAAEVPSKLGTGDETRSHQNHGVAWWLFLASPGLICWQIWSLLSTFHFPHHFPLLNVSYRAEEIEYNKAHLTGYHLSCQRFARGQVCTFLRVALAIV